MLQTWLGMAVRFDYNAVYRHGNYYIRVMEPKSEMNKRGWYAVRKQWYIDVTDAIKSDHK